MRIVVLFSFLVFVNSASAESGLEYDSIWRCDESRFNWYCDIPRDEDQVENAVEKPNPKAASEEDEAVAALKKLREDAEKKGRSPSSSRRRRISRATSWPRKH